MTVRNVSPPTIVVKGLNNLVNRDRGKEIRHIENFDNRIPYTDPLVLR